MSKNITISLSNKNLDHKEITKILHSQKVEANVSVRDSVVCNDKTCWNEKGCLIEFIKPIEVKKLETTWDNIKETNKLNSAHLHYPNNYDGCINKFPHFTQNKKRYIDEKEDSVFSNMFNRIIFI